jgi:hypothetical protein
MKAAAIFLAMFAGIFAAMVLLLVGSVKEWRAVEDRARERQIANARMNARLLRLNI